MALIVRKIYLYYYLKELLLLIKIEKMYQKYSLNIKTFIKQLVVINWLTVEVCKNKNNKKIHENK